MTTLKTFAALALGVLVAFPGAGHAASTSCSRLDPNCLPTIPHEDPNEPGEPGGIPQPGLEPIRPRDPRPRIEVEQPSLFLDCEIRDGAAATDVFSIVNVGSTTLPGGLRLSYSVPATGDRGVFLLPGDILVGNTGKLRGLISEKVASGSECRIQILS